MAKAAAATGSLDANTVYSVFAGSDPAPGWSTPNPRISTVLTMTRLAGLEIVVRPVR